MKPLGDPEPHANHKNTGVAADNSHTWTLGTVLLRLQCAGTHSLPCLAKRPELEAKASRRRLLLSSDRVCVCVVFSGREQEGDIAEVESYQEVMDMAK